MNARNISVSAIVAVGILLTGLARSADTPTYKDGYLTIPSVSTGDQAGKFQDVVFKYTEQGTWQLLGVRSIGTIITSSGLGLTSIDKVDVIKTDSFPVQIFLRVTGLLDDCYDARLGQINQRMEGSRFDVVITFNSFTSYPPTQVAPGVISCLPSIKSFQKTIPLSVYGLSAGTYSYNVNGTTGTFTLAADNKYSGDY